MNRPLVLVTGGAGFLGEHVTRAFLAHGHNVRIFDSATPPAWAGAPEIECIQGDVRDPDAVRSAARGASVIVHAAFASPRQQPDVIRAVNIDGTSHVLAAARQNHISRIVLISSTIVTASPRTHPLSSRAPLSRLDLYRTTRMEAERLSTEASRSGLSIAVVRPQSFLGPGRLGAFGIIFELIRTNQPVPVLGDGSHRYQLLAVQDLAEGVCLLATSEATGVFAFGASQCSTVREDLQAFIDRVGSSSSLRYIPAPLGKPALKAIELAGFVPLSEWHRHSAWGRDSIANSSRAEHELHWKARRSNVDALTEAYQWYASMRSSDAAIPRTHPLPRTHSALRFILRLLPRT